MSAGARPPEGGARPPRGAHALARAFGEFAASARFEHLPGSAVAAARIRVLDLLGAALCACRFGRDEPLAAIIESSGPTTVWGRDRRAGTRDATLVNTFLAHALYLEDGPRYTGGHPSSVVIPGALGLAEAGRLSGRELITAVAVGYEIFLRLGRALYPSLLERGFQSTAVLSAIACAGACANLQRLSGEQARHAVAIASTLGVGFKASARCAASQPLQVAHGAVGGLTAALLAGRGLPGAEDIIERGFLPAFAARPRLEGVTDGLGESFLIEDTYLKLHGGCRGNHAPVDALCRLMADTPGLDAGAVARIEVDVDTATHDGEIASPANGGQAQYSVAFAIASRLLLGDASIFRYTDENVADPRFRDLMARVSVRIDPALDRNFPVERGARVRVSLRDGTVREAWLSNAMGEPEHPVSHADIERKFLLHAGEVLPDRGRAIVDGVRALERLDDVGDLARLLRGPVPRQA